MKLSFIITARNDNYGGEFLERLFLFQKSLSYQIEQKQIPAELVVVEWNPPENSKHLIDCIEWTKRRKYLQIRIITVPEKYHRLFPNEKGMPLLEYPGKNVGIRRAKSANIVITNPDIVFSDKLLTRMLTEELPSDILWRTDRFDYKLYPEKMAVVPEQKILREIKKQINLCYTDEGMYPVTNYFRRKLYDLLEYWPSSFTFRGFRNVLTDPVALLYYYHKKIFLSENHIHTVAPGDFIFVRKENLEKCHGFAEIFDTYTALDLIMCYQLNKLGLKEKLLLYPHVIYHAHHSHKTASARKVFPEMQRICNEINSGFRDFRINDDSWGLAGVSLSEIKL